MMMIDSIFVPCADVSSCCVFESMQRLLCVSIRMDGELVWLFDPFKWGGTSQDVDE